MQVIKKVIYSFMFVFLSGCTVFNPKNDNGIVPPKTIEQNFGEATNFRVAMLLPLSGPAAKHGEGLRNAALMALEDVNNPNMLLQFYDTKGTSSGARIAVENALNQKSQLIIGPLMASEVQAISPQTKDNDIPVITFSTSNDVVGDGVYSLGLMVGEQVDRVVSYAAKNGRKKLALLLPDNSTGISVAKAAIISAQRNEIEISKIAFYPPATNDFSNILRSLTDYDIRSNRVKDLRAKLTSQVEAGDQNSAKVLARLKSIDSLGDVEFDAILIPESGYRLKSAVAMLGYYDVSAPKVKILGTTLWEGYKLNNEGNFIGSWYPVISTSHNSYFINKYSELFDEKPTSLYAFGYDSVALASTIASRNYQSVLKEGIVEDITNPEGYAGINGVFRIFADGSNQHSLDIIEVTSSGDIVKNSAPRKFESFEYVNLRDVKIPEGYMAPQIIGKDVSEAQISIYGYPLPEENQFVPGEPEDEAKIIKKALRKHRIYIP